MRRIREEGFDASDAIQLLTHERSEIRLGLASIHKSFNMVLLAVPVFIGSVAAVILDADAALICAVGFILSQVLFYLALYASALLCGGGVHGGYLTFLEEQINAKAGETMLRWESDLGAKFYNWRSRFALAIFCLCVVVLVALVSAVWISSVAAGSSPEVDKLLKQYLPFHCVPFGSASALILAVGTTEAALATFVVILAGTQEKRVYNYLKDTAAAKPPGDLSADS